MAHVSPKADVSDYIGHDVNSSLSQPLLTYLRRCRPIEGGELKSGKKYTDVFHDVLLSDGTERAIPESPKSLRSPHQSDRQWTWGQEREWKECEPLSKQCLVSHG